MDVDPKVPKWQKGFFPNLQSYPKFKGVEHAMYKSFFQEHQLFWETKAGEAGIYPEFLEPLYFFFHFMLSSIPHSILVYLCYHVVVKYFPENVNHLDVWIYEVTVVMTFTWNGCQTFCWTNDSLFYNTFVARHELQQYWSLWKGQFCHPVSIYKGVGKENSLSCIQQLGGVFVFLCENIIFWWFVCKAFI